MTLHQHSAEAHILVFGNDRSGAGTSTAAMQAAIALLRLGYRVGTLDLDPHNTLTRYLQNREGRGIPSPLHRAVQTEVELAPALDELRGTCDFIIIDTGADAPLSRLGHACADTLVTPVNDSLAGLAALGSIDPKTQGVTGPSAYTKMVEAQNVEKVINGKAPIHWIVMRNRLGQNRHQQETAALLEIMSTLFGFQPVPGFGERAIFPELFSRGLTLLDLKEEDQPLTLSQLAARQEVRALVMAIGPEKIRGYVRPLHA